MSNAEVRAPRRALAVWLVDLLRGDVIVELDPDARSVSPDETGRPQPQLELGLDDLP